MLWWMGSEVQHRRTTSFALTFLEFLCVARPVNGNTRKLKPEGEKKDQNETLKCSICFSVNLCDLIYFNFWFLRLCVWVWVCEFVSLATTEFIWKANKCNRRLNNKKKNMTTTRMTNESVCVKIIIEKHWRYFAAINECENSMQKK